MKGTGIKTNKNHWERSASSSFKSRPSRNLARFLARNNVSKKSRCRRSGHRTPCLVHRGHRSQSHSDKNPKCASPMIKGMNFQISISSKPQSNESNATSGNSSKEIVTKSMTKRTQLCFHRNSTSSIRAIHRKIRFIKSCSRRLKIQATSTVIAGNRIKIFRGTFFHPVKFLTTCRTGNVL